MGGLRFLPGQCRLGICNCFSQLEQIIHLNGQIAGTIRCALKSFH
jgi:hypothetical protein